MKLLDRLLGCSRDDAGDRRKGVRMQTATGRRFFPLDPRADEVEIFDVAHGLSMVCRYGGHTRWHYSVALHAVYVSRYVEPWAAREALLHDSSEAYLGDMIRPLKHTRAMRRYRKAEAKVEAAVCERFGLSLDPEVWREVKRIDDRILVDETRQLMADPSMYELRGEPVGVTIERLRPDEACAEFLWRFVELFPEIELPRAALEDA